MRMHRITNGFTLIELLVVVGVVALLVAILLPVLGRSRDTARCVKELSAARTLVQAVAVRAVDRDGQIIDGMTNMEPGIDPTGRRFTSIESVRYPWRLLNYLDHNLAGSVLVNDQATKLATPPEGTGPGDAAYEDWLYNVSVDPSFGMNVNNVGGNRSEVLGVVSNAGDDPGVVRLIDEAATPSRLITFASAFTVVPEFVNGELKQSFPPGYFRVTAPNSRNASFRWRGTSYDPAALPEDTGNVHFRCSDNAVVSNLDGSVTYLDYESVRDMTRWNNLAALSGDPNYTHPPF